jgi:hypothetical protein
VTPDSLVSKLTIWSSRFSAAAPPSGPSPIALYQELYALVHDLKSSLGLALDPQLGATLPLVTSIDAVLRPLAESDLELSPESNELLAATARSLSSLEALATLLTTEARRAETPAAVEPSELALPYSWDSLSRARAKSCARHGYTFFTRVDETTVAGLTALDRQITDELRPSKGILVARKLDMASGAPAGNSVALVAKTLAALPAGRPVPSALWRKNESGDQDPDQD